MIEQLEQWTGIGLVGLILIGILVSIVGLFVYFLPTIISANTNIFKKMFVINLLLGWSVIGWIIMLFFAATADPREKSVASTVMGNTDSIDLKAKNSTHNNPRSTPEHILFSEKVLVIPSLPDLLFRPLWCVDSGSWDKIREGDWVNPGDVLVSFVVKHPTGLGIMLGRDKPMVAEVRSPIKGRLLIRNSWPFGDFGSQPEPHSSLCAIEIPSGEHIPPTLNDTFGQFCETLWNYRKPVFQSPTDGSFHPHSDEEITRTLDEIRALSPQVRTKDKGIYRHLVDRLNLERPDSIGSPENLKRG